MNEIIWFLATNKPITCLYWWLLLVKETYMTCLRMQFCEFWAHLDGHSCSPSKTLELTAPFQARINHQPPIISPFATPCSNKFPTNIVGLRQSQGPPWLAPANRAAPVRRCVSWRRWTFALRMTSSLGLGATDDPFRPNRSRWCNAGAVEPTWSWEVVFERQPRG